jgi:putative transposase
VVIETVRYPYRLGPGVQAERGLLAKWGGCRFLWNEAVHQHKTGLGPTVCGLSKLLTGVRGRFSWLREGSQVAWQRMLRSYSRSLNHSLTVRGRGRPKLEGRKKVFPSLGYTTRGFSIRDGSLRLPFDVSIPGASWSRELPPVPTSVRVYQDRLGHWFASFVVRREVDPVTEISGGIGIGIGIDWGVITTATIAFDLPYLGYRKRCTGELATAERIRAGGDDIRHLLLPSGDVVGAGLVRNPLTLAIGNR